MPEQGGAALAPADERRRLRADCGQCAALCCVAPVFAASTDFAIDKPAGQPCPNLRRDFRCGIHDRLRDHGFPGCAVFDCFGAGQAVVQETFSGADWRRSPELAEPMFAVLPVMRQLKELLWYLAEARTLVPPGPLLQEVERLQGETRQLTRADAEALLALDLTAERARVGPLLERVSERARAGVARRGRDRRGADLIGASLRGADLRGVSLRGAYLLGADLRGADLTRADLLGADLRGADLRGARLDTVLFLTQPQLDAAIGDDSTTLPTALARPRHWGGQPG